MRLHERTTNHVPRRAWLWLILAAATVPAPVRAEDRAEPAGPCARLADPIDLRAETIRVWSAGPVQWIYLGGRVAIVQGPGVLRAESAVVRLTTEPTPGKPARRLEVYAEGQVRTLDRGGTPLPSAHDSFLTESQVNLKPSTARAILREPGPPRDLAILDRAFPEPAAADGFPLVRPAASGPVPAPADQPDGDRSRAGPRMDREVVPTQFEPEGFPGQEGVPAPGPEDLPPALDTPGGPGPAAIPIEPPVDADPLPGPGFAPTGPRGAGNRPAAGPPEDPSIPILPGSQRKTRIYPLTGGPDFTIQRLPDVDGYMTLVIRGGVQVVTEGPPPLGIIDLSADSVVIWRRVGAQRDLGPNNEVIEPAGEPMELYLEGNVIIRQDKRQVAGIGDNQGYIAKRAYYDMRTGRAIVLEAELDMFAPGLIVPTKLFSPRIEQYRPVVPGANGGLAYGLEEIRADRTVITGSRFPIPGYRFNSRSIDINHVVSAKANPNTGRTAGDPRNPQTPQDLTWRIDARQNVFYMGPVPVFYWPRILADADDIEPPLRQIQYGYNNYFGQMVLADFNAFRLFGIRRPQWIDAWNLDIDYLAMRTKSFPALGSEIGWFGKDFLADVLDPYRRETRPANELPPEGYYGYLDLWGLRDYGVDVLGSGPAIETPNGRFVLPNGTPPGKRGFQRGVSGIPGLPNGAPPFQNFRGRFNMRHMQSLLDAGADPYEDFRFQVEAGYVSDRYFLEEYYKRLSETGLDQETLGYLIRQKENWAWSVWAEANLQNFYTDTQWLPRLDYYRLGDSPLNNWLTYYQHSGVDYANVHTAVEVNNPNIFAFMPFDPISNTSGPWRSGRLYSNHEVDLPLNFGNIVRVIPYVQGQAVGWDNQINGSAVGRVWGAAGARADIMAWRRYPDVESDLFNVHGINHKVTFEADYRNAYSNLSLNRIGVQDDLDDNKYEEVRRYFALTQYIGGVLPPQYDPRHLILRRTISPITGTTDAQTSIETLQLNLHSRLQTKRGPEGRRRIIDFMTLDLTTTFFPYAQRDNFGKPFGQNMYNWQWFIGDRTSLLSYGWFEFFDITGQPTNKATTHLGNNPFGLNVITSGVSISRPPRANIFIGYTILDSGQVTTSALNPSISYWMSPKWYATFSTSYDFGNAIWLSSMFSFTRVGADYLTTIGLVVDPQRNNFSQFAIAISPRISPGLRLGSGNGLTQFDSRYAPTQ